VNVDVNVNIPCTLPLANEMHLLFFINLDFFFFYKHRNNGENV